MRKTRKSKYSGTELPSDLKEEWIPTLFSMYKYGLFVQRNTRPGDFDRLKADGYVDFVESRNTGYSSDYLVMLTDKGAEWVERNALGLLKVLSPAYTFPIIISGDKLDVLTSQLAFAKKYAVTLVDVVRGIHTVHSINRGQVMVSHENTPSLVRGVSLRPSKDCIRFATPIEYTKQEFDKRFGKIRVNNILNVTEAFNNLLVADMLDRLYNSQVAKNRIEKYE